MGRADAAGVGSAPPLPVTHNCQRILAGARGSAAQATAHSAPPALAQRVSLAGSERLGVPVAPLAKERETDAPGVDEGLEHVVLGLARGLAVADDLCEDGGELLAGPVAAAVGLRGGRLKRGMSGWAEQSRETSKRRQRPRSAANPPSQPPPMPSTQARRRCEAGATQTAPTPPKRRRGRPHRDREVGGQDADWKHAQIEVVEEVGHALEEILADLGRSGEGRAQRERGSRSAGAGRGSENQRCSGGEKHSHTSRPRRQRLAVRMMRSPNSLRRFTCDDGSGRGGLGSSKDAR